MWSIVGTFVFISLFAVPSILAHSANVDKKASCLKLSLYGIYFIYLLSYLLIGYYYLARSPEPLWLLGVTLGCSFLIVSSLFVPFRKLISIFLSSLNRLASFDFLAPKSIKTALNVGIQPAFHDASMIRALLLPESIAQLNGFVLFLFALGISLQRVRPEGMLSPSLTSLPEFRAIDFNILADFLSTLVVVACGVGVFISRRAKEVLYRLSLVKPGKKEFAIGIALCGLTFLYDLLWSYFTHNPSQASSGYPGVMKAFNEGAYLGRGDFSSAIFMATAIGIIAGVEEEITNRGALQPALGIVPAALLHATLHSQFSAAPLFIIQIFGWSALMGTVKYYTNTTTTMIAHGLFNFISCFLIGFNP